MEINSLVGKSLEDVLIYPSGPVHPAWVDDLTLPINTWSVFIKVEGGEIFNINPCEVSMSDERYPSLGLKIETNEGKSLDYIHSDGQIIKAVSVKELSGYLPQVITQVKETDPLEEGAVSQYTLILSDLVSIVVRHIMPPMTLGLSVENGNKTPNNGN